MWLITPIPVQSRIFSKISEASYMTNFFTPNCVFLQTSFWQWAVDKKVWKISLSYDILISNENYIKKGSTQQNYHKNAIKYLFDIIFYQIEIFIFSFGIMEKVYKITFPIDVCKRSAKEFNETRYFPNICWCL